MTVTTETAWSHTFTHNKKRVTVTMVSPEMAADGSMTVIHSGVLYLYEKPKHKIKTPTWSVGVIAEATFRVEGLECDLTFTTGWTFDSRHPERNDGSPNQKDVSIYSMSLDGHRPITPELLARIPAGKLLAAAIHAAGVRVIHYPKGYEGPSLSMLGWNVSAQDENDWDVAGHLGIDIPTDLVKSLTGEKEQIDYDARLLRVAEIVKASLPNRQTKDVAQSFFVGDRQARRLIQDARDAGYLPPIDPTDKRSRKAKQ